MYVLEDADEIGPVKVMMSTAKSPSILWMSARCVLSALNPLDFSDLKHVSIYQRDFVGFHGSGLLKDRSIYSLPSWFLILAAER